MKQKLFLYLFLVMFILIGGIKNTSHALTIGTPDNSFLSVYTNGGGGGNIPNAYFELIDYENSFASNTFSWDNPLYGSGNVFASADFNSFDCTSV